MGYRPESYIKLDYPSCPLVFVPDRADLQLTHSSVPVEVNLLLAGAKCNKRAGTYDGTQILPTGRCTCLR